MNSVFAILPVICGNFCTFPYAPWSFSARLRFGRVPSSNQFCNHSSPRCCDPPTPSRSRNYTWIEILRSSFRVQSVIPLQRCCLIWPRGLERSEAGLPYRSFQ